MPKSWETMGLALLACFPGILNTNSSVLERASLVRIENCWNENTFSVLDLQGLGLPDDSHHLRSAGLKSSPRLRRRWVMVFWGSYRSIHRENKWQQSISSGSGRQNSQQGKIHDSWKYKMSTSNILFNLSNEETSKILGLVHRIFKDLDIYRQFNKRMLGYNCWARYKTG